MRLPQLHDDLVSAAARRSSRRRRATPWTLVIAATIALGAGGTAAAVLTGTVGGRPSLFAARRGPAPEPQIEITTGKVVLGVGRLPRAGRWELVGHRYKPRATGAEDELCLDVVLVRRRVAYGCGDPSSRVQGVSRDSENVQLTGATTSDEVVAVRVHFSVRDEKHVRPASVVHVPADIATRVGIEQAFSFYVAELPGGARRLVAEALDGRGERVWTAACPLPAC